MKKKQQFLSDFLLKDLKFIEIFRKQTKKLFIKSLNAPCRIFQKKKLFVRVKAVRTCAKDSLKICITYKMKNTHTSNTSFNIQSPLQR